MGRAEQLGNEDVGGMLLVEASNLECPQIVRTPIHPYTCNLDWVNGSKNHQCRGMKVDGLLTNAGIKDTGN